MFAPPPPPVPFGGLDCSASDPYRKHWRERIALKRQAMIDADIPVARELGRAVKIFTREDAVWAMRLEQEQHDNMQRAERVRNLGRLGLLG